MTGERGLANEQEHLHLVPVRFTKNSDTLFGSKLLLLSPETTTLQIISHLQLE